MEDSRFRTVVGASDGSAAAEGSLPFAKGVAESSGARLIVIYVHEAGGADLIVTGTRGKNPLVGLLVGSVTSRPLEIAPCPVLAVPSTQPQSADS